MALKEIIPNFLEILVLLSDAIIVLIILSGVYWFFLRKEVKIASSFNGFLKNNYLLFGLIVSLTATLGSLYYSEIMGFAPCILCWYQRIFMYPQVLLFAVALWKRDWRVVRYSLAFSLVGGVIALYHYITQIGILKGACDVIGYSSACSEFFFLSYGYITIPMMALTAFIMLFILGMLRVRK